MKYLMVTTPDPNGETPPPPSPEEFAEMGKFMEESFRDGTLIATGTLDPIVTKIVSKGGQFTLTDGPFTEAKEAVVGWALVNAKSRDHAIELSKRFWKIVGDGEGIIQRAYDPNEGPPRG